MAGKAEGTDAPSRTEDAPPFDPKAFVSDLVQEFNLRHFNTHASSTTYFYFLAIVPVFIFLSSILPFTEFGEEEIGRAVRAVAPAVVSSFIETVVSESFQHAGTLIPISAVTLAWTSVQGNMALLRGMDSAYREPETRPYWKRLLISFLWTTLLMAVFLLLMYLVFSRKIAAFFEDYLPMYRLKLLDFSATRIVLAAVVIWLFLALTYWVMPDGKRRFQDQLAGALLVAVAWLVFSAFFSLYVNGVNKFTSFYGTLGTFAIALFWMYCFFYILLVGGFVNDYFQKDISRLMDAIAERLSRPLPRRHRSA